MWQIYLMINQWRKEPRLGPQFKKRNTLSGKLGRLTPKWRRRLWRKVSFLEGFGGDLLKRIDGSPTAWKNKFGFELELIEKVSMTSLWANVMKSWACDNIGVDEWPCCNVRPSKTFCLLLLQRKLKQRDALQRNELKWNDSRFCIFTSKYD